MEMAIADFDTFSSLGTRANAPLLKNSIVRVKVKEIPLLTSDKSCHLIASRGFTNLFLFKEKGSLHKVTESTLESNVGYVCVEKKKKKKD